MACFDIDGMVKSVFATCKEYLEKEFGCTVEQMGAYKQLGNPEELRKVVFCKDCTHFRKKGTGEVMSASKDYCFWGAYDEHGYQADRYVEEDGYCNFGKPKEETEL